MNEGVSGTGAAEGLGAWTREAGGVETCEAQSCNIERKS